MFMNNLPVHGGALVRQIILYHVFEVKIFKGLYFGLEFIKALINELNLIKVILIAMVGYYWESVISILKHELQIIL